MSKVEKRNEFLASEVQELKLNIAYADLLLKEEETDKVTIVAWYEADRADRYGCELIAGKLYAGEKENGSVVVHTNTDKDAITVTLPVGMNLKTMELVLGAGNAKLSNASTKYGEIDLEAGAGKVSADALQVEGKAEIEAGAGHAEIKNLTAQKADVTCGVGKLFVSGVIAGDVNVECGVGKVEMHLDADERDYNYAISCGVGSVRVNGCKRGGLFGSGSSITNSGAKGTISLECGVGNIELVMEKLPTVQ